MAHARPRLLYISPVIPAMTGNGLAMRAGMVLEVLARRADVHLLVAPLYAPFGSRIPQPLEQLCNDTAIVAPLPQSRGWFGRGLKWSGIEFDIVHVFRLAAIPFAEPYFHRASYFHRAYSRGSRPCRALDLDDIESVTLRRIAELYRLNGEPAFAARDESQAAGREIREDEAFAKFDLVYVCSALDRKRIEGRTRAEIRVLPNGVRLPALVPARVPSGAFTFLFVGTLGYYPNEDGVRYLCAEIIPRLREIAGDAFAVNIVGTGGSDSLRQAVAGAGAQFIGEVAELDRWYAQADAIVAPVRAGGGTRIKILEAFSYSRPVVATPVAAEGIEAEEGEQVLIGDTPAAFAQQCARLMQNRNLGERLAHNALTLVEEKYTIEALEKALGQLPGC